MRSQDEHRPARIPIEEVVARPASALGIDVEVARPSGFGALDGVMHQVAGDDGILAF